ncbi:MAG: hypothetical protein M5U18_06500 [Dehalococcoidia bacterium]|nr:hypothetical protein [Dehalococcoidia bacterium]
MPRKVRGIAFRPLGLKSEPELTVGRLAAALALRECGFFSCEVDRGLVSTSWT